MPKAYTTHRRLGLMSVIVFVKLYLRGKRAGYVGVMGVGRVGGEMEPK